MSKVQTHGHWAHANEDGFDLGFIEAAHYDRDNSCKPMSLAQRPINGKTNVEVYASTTVPVLALPTLYCMVHASDHPCRYVHKIASDIGVCDLNYVGDPGRYTVADLVHIKATKSYTGHVSR